MSERPGIDRCRELAAWLATDEGLRQARHLQAAMLERAGSTGGPDPASDRAAGPPRPISIWRPRLREGRAVFVRSEQPAEGDHYAARRALEARRSRRHRICLFGESVAAGYLYSPALTPASMLERQLNQLAGRESFEVVDLARTNETLSGLVATVEAAMQLEPDLLVVFAGNNWTLLETPELSPYTMSIEGRSHFARALARDGVYGPIELAARRVLERAGAALASIARSARRRSVPVELVVPEVNLADWENRQPVLCLPGDGVARWYERYARAVDALKDEDWVGARRQGRAMVELDGGTCPTSFRIQARAWIGAGDLARAAEASRWELAAGHYAVLGFLSAPQASPMIQELQRRAAGHHGFGLIDLPRLFARQTGSPLTDRRLFLDYCHLTVAGMRLATAAIAARVARRFGVVERADVQDLLERLPRERVAPEADATAKLGAAVHTAHRLLAIGSTRPLLEHWCRAALAASPGIAEIMAALIEERSTREPAAVSAARRRVRASPYRFGAQHGWEWRGSDLELVETMSDLLAERDPEAHARCHELLLDRRAADTGGIDLASSPRHLAEPQERLFPEALDAQGLLTDGLERRLAYRAAWPSSTFCFAADGRADLELELTLRGCSGGRGRARIELNGRSLGGWTVTDAWRRRRLRLERRHLRSGFNRLSIHWPVTSEAGADPLEAVASRLELGCDADLHPIFGEVAALRLGVPVAARREAGPSRRSQVARPRAAPLARSGRAPETSGPHVVVVGGGSAGYLAALALRTQLSGVRVSLIESPDLPSIGVGEATTPLLPQFLHADLGLDIHQLFREVRPTLKLGIRFAWGSAERDTFGYPFGPLAPLDALAHGGDIEPASVQSVLMSTGRLPVLFNGRPDPSKWLPDSPARVAYHLDNAKFVAYLRRRSAERGVERLEATVVDVERSPGGGVAGLRLADGRRLSFDLYVDCTGFAARLIGEALESPFEPYRYLLTDRALAGSAPSADELAPYTLATALACGWAWSIPQRHERHVGYVYASDFVADDRASSELEARIPRISELRRFRFRAGRRTHFWKENVFALGNSYGFLEPLESTSLHLLVRQIGLLCAAFPWLGAGDARRDHLNRRVAAWWDYVSWFISLHFRFNRAMAAPFWDACRRQVLDTPFEWLLGVYREHGPLSARYSSSEELGLPDPLWGPPGIDVILGGQRARCRLPPPSTSREEWRREVAGWRRLAERAAPHRQALDLFDRRPEVLEELAHQVRAFGAALSGPPSRARVRAMLPAR